MADWGSYVESVDLFQWIYGGSLFLLLLVLSIYVPCKEAKKRKALKEGLESESRKYESEQRRKLERPQFELKTKETMKQQQVNFVLLCLHYPAQTKQKKARCPRVH